MRRERLASILNGRKRLVIKDNSKVVCSVLIPLYIKDYSYNILFTKRSEKVHQHKGQISFPGGVFSESSDNGLLDTALRETFEEVGIKSHDVDIVGPLDDLVTITGFVITPFLGLIPYPYDFKINKDEIDELIEVPVHEIFGKEQAELLHLGDQPYMHYSYTSGGNYIWGATARILKHFFDLIS